jgi:hypothetical protein
MYSGAAAHASRRSLQVPSSYFSLSHTLGTPRFDPGPDDGFLPLIVCIGHILSTNPLSAARRTTTLEGKNPDRLSAGRVRLAFSGQTHSLTLLWAPHRRSVSCARHYPFSDGVQGPGVWYTT